MEHVSTKTRNDLKPPKTTYNHLQPPTTTYKTTYNHLKPPTTTYNQLQNTFCYIFQIFARYVSNFDKCTPETLSFVSWVPIKSEINSLDK